MIGYLTQGGVTYGDTEQMTPYERKIALDTIQEVLDHQNKTRQEAVEKAKQSRKSDPKSGLTAR